jgi:hypothetical protein
MGRKIKSKEKRSGLKPPFKELSHGKLSTRKQQNSLSWLLIYIERNAKQLPYRCINLLMKRFRRSDVQRRLVKQ